MEAIHPTSVCDLGCGIGIWLHAFELFPEVKHIHGIDGAWVKNWSLEVEPDCIEIYDFEDTTNKPICVKNGERYDLAICLEMAEHLSNGRADYLIDTLTSLSNVIYFSGATPCSGGMHHVNERWPSYWIHKFRKRGYVCIDYIRPKVWNQWREICYFYAEESFLFVKEDKLDQYEKLSDYHQEPIIDCVHPEHFLNQVIKPTHDWSWLLKLQKRLIHAYRIKLQNMIHHID
nr:methyltransferase domain-containing protein [Pectinatus frisingensis]